MEIKKKIKKKNSKKKQKKREKKEYFFPLLFKKLSKARHDFPCEGEARASSLCFRRPNSSFGLKTMSLLNLKGKFATL